MIVVSPRAAALRILAERASTTIPAMSINYSLAEYQMEAVARASGILRNRGGVVIADGVGLGKTYIAAGLIERHIAEGVVVVVPAALRKNWLRALAPLIEQNPSIRLITHGMLSRGKIVDDGCLVVVDEAHAFRNPHTRRYRALRLLCRNAKVVLLTATPVNNSLADLYYQLRVFARDDAFRDLGIGSLAVLLRPGEIDSRALARLRNAVLIRRSREELRSRFPTLSLPNQQPLQFPRSVELRNIVYKPGIAASELDRLLNQVTFAIYSEETPRLLLLLSLLKRLQSSHAAALISLDRLIGFHHRFLGALEEGHWIRPRKTIRMDDEQLSFSALIAENAPHKVDRMLIKQTVARDLAALIAFRQRLRTSPDWKLPRLMDLLSARPPPARTLVFTEFSDTALELWRAVTANSQAGLITGRSAFLGTTPASRWEVIKRFAPKANGVSSPKSSEAVFVLIATDVLAEGLNLQDADAVISYDLPWNPVRLIQRAGRIDRIGSPHDGVVIHNFIPDREFDDLIGLVQRLREKLASIRSAIGRHGPALESEPFDAAFLKGLAAGDPHVLKDAVLPELHRNENLEDAGPAGCVAASARASEQVLVVMKSQIGTRELIVNGAAVAESPEVVEAVISTALSDFALHPMSGRTAESITSALRYLAREGEAGFKSHEAIALCRAVHAAVGRLGLAATPEVVDAADDLIGAAGGFLGDLRELLFRLRTARTADDLQRILEEGRATCRDAAEPPNWSLVAAIACD